MVHSGSSTRFPRQMVDNKKRHRRVFILTTCELVVICAAFKCTDNHTSHISYSSWILFSFFFTVLFNILSLTYIICGGWPSHEAGGGSFPWRRSKNSHGNFPVQLFGKISSRLGGRGGGWVVPTGYPPERKVSVTGFFDLAAYRADQARQRGMM